VARNVLASWERASERFVKVMPRDYKRVLAERDEELQDAVGA
jgi:glutamate synthase domain-containing protein 3